MPSASARWRSIFTQLNSYHVILEVTPALQGDPQRSTSSTSSRRSPASRCRCRRFVQYDTQHVSYLSINHQGQFPAVTLSFNLAPGAALGDAVDAIHQATADMRMPATDDRELPGHRAGVPESR